jgi:glycosyltransferase involved in cell wall biosynthesis
MIAVSIITVVKDNAVGLSKTLESALAQDFLDWELLIVYGQSKDDTYKVASYFCNLDSRFSLIEQRDAGIYEAMNIGIGASNADYLWFMNSGDQFYSIRTLSDGHAAISNSQVGFVVGGYRIEGDRRIFQQSDGKLTDLKFALSRRGACHQAMIFRKDSVIAAGGFDTKFRLAADYKMCIAILKDSGAAKIHEIFAKMEPNGLSDQNLS